MLNQLRTIVQDINAAGGFQGVLRTIVEQVHSAMDTEVCSVYLLDAHTGRYVLMDTEGLSQDLIGQVSLGLDGSIVGRVASRAEPINLHNASEHPDYYYVEELGEEKFDAFLGAPIIHHRKVMGVLVVQQTDQRHFDADEEAFLVTVAAQLASVMSHADATGALAKLVNPSHRKEIVFRGSVGCTGVAIGKAVVIRPPADLNVIWDKPALDIDAELRFFQYCLERVRNDLKKVGEELGDRLNKEEKDLFEAYLHMIDDNALGGEISERIKAGQWGQGAVSQVIQTHAQAFDDMQDEYLKERALDVKDLGRRILSYLQQSDLAALEYPKHTILIGEELTASILGEVPQDRLAGLVSLKGSSNSHVAILARAMGVPTVMGVMDLPYRQLDGQEIIVDGYSGVVYSSAPAERRRHYRNVVREEKELIRGLEALVDLPAQTTDGHSIALYVNTGLEVDVMRSLSRGAEGIGLYRTEVPFMMRDRFPSEDQQAEIYRQQLEAFAPRAVTMRTLDVGGDKPLPYFPIEEDNPALGWRGIRVTLDHPEVFLQQTRAMLKASIGLDNLKILLPMISTVDEVEQAEQLLCRAKAELIEEGYKIATPELGVMIEVPAAVYQTGVLAKRADFISVGSNDLTQYLLAVDRNNAQVSSLYHSYHPAVLRALYDVAQQSKKENTPVSICGELAGEPAAAILLLAMGYDVLSMNAAGLLKVKAVIRQVDMSFAQELLTAVLDMEHAEDVRMYLDRALEEIGIEPLLRGAGLY